MKISAQEAYNLFKSAKAIVINHAVSMHLVESNHGEYSLDGSYLLEGTDIEQSYSMQWEEGDNITINKNAILLEEMEENEGTKVWKIQLLMLKPLPYVREKIHRQEKKMPVLVGIS